MGQGVAFVTSVDANRIAAERQAWATDASLRYYRTHRRTAADLYPSERFFLPDVARRVSTCLDVGCAVGHFGDIMRSFNPALRYTGVDTNPAFVAAAREEHPGDTFLEGDGIHFSTPPNSYELVHLSGVLHLTALHREMTAACYEQASRFLLCDFRLTTGRPATGRMRLAFGGGADGAGELPYHVLNVDDLLAGLKALTPAPVSIALRGYTHSPAADVTLPMDKVIMAFALIEKGSGAGPTRIETIFDKD